MEEIKIKGKIIHGNGRGKLVGMPTANLEYDVDKLDIENAVYASVVYIDKEYIGVTNVGRRPSVDDDEKITIETNIIDFDRDIYGEEIEIILLDKIRDIKKFENLTEVKKQVDKDKLKSIEIYNKYKKSEEKK